MANLPIDFHPEGRREADAAFSYYLERNHRVADAFYRALETSLSAIQKSPEVWAEYLYGTRRYLLRRFPFIVVYRATERRIEIVAVAHGRRKPGYWAHRLA
jgi:toxin ParE1/3/4